MANRPFRTRRRLRRQAQALLPRLEDLSVEQIIARMRPEELRPAAASPFATADRAFAGDQTGAAEPFGAPLAAPSPLQSGALAGLQRNALSDDGLSLEAPGAGRSVRNGGVDPRLPDAGVPSIPSVAQGPRLSSLGRAPEESPFLRQPPLAPPWRCANLLSQRNVIMDGVSLLEEGLAEERKNLKDMQNKIEKMQDSLEGEILSKSGSQSKISNMRSNIE